MKIQGVERTHETNLTAKPTQFKIAASAKAFQILSGNLYSDRILAIIRELICNGVDAHKSAGKDDVPIEVHLPSTLDPEFRVKDYGVGLSDEAIHTLYTTYFDSDKTHTDELIGGLGLGSKSPFSYTDQFTVKSRYNKQLRTYQAYIGADGTPAIMQVGSTEITNEPNGLEVIVPIKESDQWVFKDKYISFAKWMPVPPVCNQVTLPEHEVLTTLNLNDGGKFHVLEKQGSGYVGSELKIRMGLVTYTEDADYSVLEIIRRGLIEVPLGTFTVAPSREKLSMNQKEKAKLQAILKDIKDQITAHANSIIKSQKTRFEAMASYREFSRQLNSTVIQDSWTHPVTNQRYELKTGSAAGQRLPKDLEVKLVVPTFSRVKNIRTDGDWWRIPEPKKPVAVLWSEKRRPFMNHIEDNVELGNGDYVWVCHGPEGDLRSFLATWDMEDEYEELPKASVAASAAPGTAQPKVYSPTVYNGAPSWEADTVTALKWMAEDPKKNKLVLTTEDLKEGAGHLLDWEMTRYLACIADLNIRWLQVYPSHTRVRKDLTDAGAFESERAYMRTVTKEEWEKLYLKLRTHEVFEEDVEWDYRFHRLDLIRQLQDPTLSIDPDLKALSGKLLNLYGNRRWDSDYLVTAMKERWDVPKISLPNFPALNKQAKAAIKTLKDDIQKAEKKYPALFGRSHTSHLSTLIKTYITHIHSKEE